jgi:hypothetical protein
VSVKSCNSIRMPARPLGLDTARRLPSGTDPAGPSAAVVPASRHASPAFSRSNPTDIQSDPPCARSSRRPLPCPCPTPAPAGSLPGRAAVNPGSPVPDLQSRFPALSFLRALGLRSSCSPASEYCGRSAVDHLHTLQNITINLQAPMSSSHNALALSSPHSTFAFRTASVRRCRKHLSRPRFRCIGCEEDC